MTTVAMCLALPCTALAEARWYAVTSSWIDALGYEDYDDNDPATGYAIMQLRNGYEYEYYEMSEAFFFDWLYAYSVGEFHNTWIKDSFNFQRTR